jgi:serine/threonine protein kinase
VDNDRLSRAADIYRASLARSPQERDAYAIAACGNDPSLLAVVQDMLRRGGRENETRAIETPGGAATASVAAAAPQPNVHSGDLSGARIGHYELVRRIGRGGMGSVYAARRVDHEFRKLVAIKFVKPGSESDEILLRFKNERQVLASLEHPNISRLFDGGTDHGIPYLVMEYVEGTPIDKYCSSHRLFVDERLKLFCIVCSAVQYAHQRMVVHRDIKPSNILVTADGTPKLLDFGIAKVLTPEYGDMAAMTAVSRPMTPDFASPEQVRGEPVTTSTDVYALGVLLYELLTTQHPLRHRYKELGFERAVLETEPERPSVLAARIDRNVAAIPEEAPEKLAAKLRGDLDAIILMALRKEPQRRYASVQHFADDIQRYLNGAPVRAQRDTVGYRAKKFVRRHTGAVLAAAAAVLALAASTVVSWTYYREASRERERAEARFADVRELARFVLFDFDKVIASGVTPARKAVIEKATEYLGRLEKDRGADASLESELVEGYLKIGDLQGNLNGPNLGDREAAKASYDRALKILDASRHMDPMLLAKTRVRLADLLEQAGSPKDAIAAYEKARQVFERSAPGAGARRVLLDLLPKLALAQTELGDYPAAERTYAALIETAASLEQANPGVPEYRRMIAYGELRAGDVRARMGDPSGLRRMERALGMYEDLAAAAPHSAGAQRAISVASALIGDVLALGNRDKEAVRRYRRALDATETLAGADPRNEQFQRDRFTYLGRLADALAKSGDIAGARSMTRRLLAELKPAVDGPGASEFSLWQYAWTLLTTPCADYRDPAEARRYAERLVAMSRGQDPSALDLLARAHAGVGEYSRAAEIERQAVGLLPPGLSTDLRRELEDNLSRFSSAASKSSPLR